MNKEQLRSYIKKAETIKSLITFNDQDFVSAGFFNKNFSRENITKDHYTLMYVICGEGIYIDENGEKTEMHPGTLILRHPGKVHSVRRNIHKKWLEFYIIIPGYFYEFLQKSESIPENDISTIPLNSQWLKTLTNLMDKCSQYALNNKERIFPELQNFYLNLKEKLTQKRKYHSGQNEVLEICRIIDENPSLRLTNHDLADKAGFGIEHFRKIFREVVGCAPQEYMISSRIQAAQKLLIDDKFKLENIAFKLGYPDLPSFSRQFKKMTSLSPTEFKKLINEN